MAITVVKIFVALGTVSSLKLGHGACARVRSQVWILAPALVGCVTVGKWLNGSALVFSSVSSFYFGE